MDYHRVREKFLHKTIHLRPIMIPIRLLVYLLSLSILVPFRHLRQVGLVLHPLQFKRILMCCLLFIIFYPLRSLSIN